MDFANHCFRPDEDLLPIFGRQTHDFSDRRQRQLGCQTMHEIAVFATRGRLLDGGNELGGEGFSQRAEMPTHRPHCALGIGPTALSAHMPMARIVHEDHVRRLERVPPTLSPETVETAAHRLLLALQTQTEPRAAVDEHLGVVGNREDVGITRDSPERFDVIALVPVDRCFPAQLVPRHPRMTVARVIRGAMDVEGVELAAYYYKLVSMLPRVRLQCRHTFYAMEQMITQVAMFPAVSRARLARASRRSSPVTAMWCRPTPSLIFIQRNRGKTMPCFSPKAAMPFRCIVDVPECAEVAYHSSCPSLRGPVWCRLTFDITGKWTAIVAMTMTQEQFETLVARLEQQAAHHPAAYKFKLGAFATLGYAYVFGMLFVLLGVTAGLVYAIATGKATILAKLVILIGILVAVVLKSLWVKLEAPCGLQLTAHAFPRLFEVIDEIRQATGAPRAHKVLMTDELNASIVQVPRLGMFGWQENYLILGLPLMQLLSVSEFKAVLAHEFGHLSGAHGRFGAWIYRIRAGWARLARTLEANRQWGRFPVRAVLQLVCAEIFCLFFRAGASARICGRPGRGDCVRRSTARRRTRAARSQERRTFAPLLAGNLRGRRRRTPATYAALSGIARCRATRLFTAGVRASARGARPLNRHDRYPSVASRPARSAGATGFSAGRFRAKCRRVPAWRRTTRAGRSLRPDLADRRWQLVAESTRTRLLRARKTRRTQHCPDGKNGWRNIVGVRNCGRGVHRYGTGVRVIPRTCRGSRCNGRCKVRLRAPDAGAERRVRYPPDRRGDGWIAGSDSIGLRADCRISAWPRSRGRSWALHRTLPCSARRGGRTTRRATVDRTVRRIFVAHAECSHARRDHRPAWRQQGSSEAGLRRA